MATPQHLELEEEEEEKEEERGAGVRQKPSKRSRNEGGCAETGTTPSLGRGGVGQRPLGTKGLAGKGLWSWAGDRGGMGVMVRITATPAVPRGLDRSEVG